MVNHEHGLAGVRLAGGGNLGLVFGPCEESLRAGELRHHEERVALELHRGGVAVRRLEKHTRILERLRCVRNGLVAGVALVGVGIVPSVGEDLLRLVVVAVHLLGDLPVRLVAGGVVPVGDVSVVDDQLRPLGLEQLQRHPDACATGDSLAHVRIGHHAEPHHRRLLRHRERPRERHERRRADQKFLTFQFHCVFPFSAGTFTSRSL